MYRPVYSAAGKGPGTRNYQLIILRSCEDLDVSGSDTGLEGGQRLAVSELADEGQGGKLGAPLALHGVKRDH